MASDTLTFGPQGDQWQYDKPTKTYDLTRGATRALKIQTTYGPDDTFISVSPEKSALVIVDMQNFFLDKSFRQHATGLAAVEPTLRVIEKCREVGIQVRTEPFTQDVTTVYPTPQLHGQKSNTHR